MGNFKSKNQKIPIEQHSTAAWADIKRLKRKSKVSIPSDFQVENAKDYVDENEK